MIRLAVRYVSNNNNRSTLRAGGIHFSERLTLGSERIFDNWETFKMMKNIFYFTLKALVVLRIFKFLSSLFAHVSKQLDWNKINFKIYDVTTLEKVVEMHILPIILESKDNQTVKFDHLIEYLMRNTFLEK